MRKNVIKIAMAIAAWMMPLTVSALDYSNPANNNYVSEWGKLKLVGNQLSSESGARVQLRGWSTHGKNWQGGCFDDKDDFELMKAKGANVARIAMYLKEGGYEDINWIKQCIEWTNALGMYCVVDWHVLSPGNPNSSDYSGAENFFRSLCTWVVDNNYKNVLYEICNEPNIDVEGATDPYRPDVWEWVKRYTKKILPAIAEKDKDAIVIVGTPQNDLAPEFAITDPIDTYGLNVMYSFHYATCSHQQYLGKLNAIAAFIPVFVTQWCVSKDDGGVDGQVCTGDGDLMLQVCNGKNLGNQVISWCNWSWSADSRSSSAFSSYPNTMKESGQYIETQLKKGDQFAKLDPSSSYDDKSPVLGDKDCILKLDHFDRGGNGVAYYDFDLEEWGQQSPGNLGDAGKDGIRQFELVDLGYTDKNDKENCYRSIDHIVPGEWVSYSIDVNNPGCYEFELLTNNHIGRNLFTISVDGQNGIVNKEDGTVAKVRGFYVAPCKGGSEDGGYDEWGWTKPTASPDAAKEEWSGSKFYIKFDKKGSHTLSIVFLSSCPGLGALKLIAKSAEALDDYFVGSNEWATYYNDADIAYDVPQGMKAYAVTGTSGNNVAVEEMAVLPPYKVVLLKKGTATSFTKIPHEGDYTAPNVNLLKHAEENVETNGSQYVLYNNEFVKATGNIPQGKNYLDFTTQSSEVSSVATRGFYSIGEDEATGIREVTLRQAQGPSDDAWYLLDGRKLSGQPTKKGIYIYKGKKVKR